MNNFLSERARSIKPSITLTISAKTKTIRAEGIDVLDFSAGEPNFDTPQVIKQIAVEAMAEGFTKKRLPEVFPKSRTPLSPNNRPNKTKPTIHCKCWCPAVANTRFTISFKQC